MSSSGLGRSRAMARRMAPAVALSQRPAPATSRPSAVWYASYGSNMARARFTAYIAGGRPPGGGRWHAGARDKTPPARDLPATFDRDIFFAAWSGQWGGPVAFMGSSPGAALSRLYLITADQFDDVVVQENGGQPPGPVVDTLTALREGVAPAGTGFYDRLVCFGTFEGVPVLSFTTAGYRPDATPGARASAAYLAVIARGLAESAGLDLGSAVDYLTGYPGADGWDGGDLTTAILSEWERWN